MGVQPVNQTTFNQTVTFPEKSAAASPQTKTSPAGNADLDELLARLKPLSKGEQHWVVTRFAEKFSHLPFEQSQDFYNSLLEKLDSAGAASKVKAGKTAEPSQHLLMDIYNAISTVHDQQLFQHLHQGSAAPTVNLF